MKNIRRRRILFLFIPVTVFMLLFFFFLFSGRSVSADAGNLNDMKSYESVLVRDGDTISSLADCYAEKYSHFSKKEYIEAIVSLNNLSSEYIQSGSYLLLPQYKE